MKRDIYLSQDRAEQYVKLAGLPAAVIHEIGHTQQWIPGRRAMWAWPVSELDVLINRHRKTPPDVELVMTRWQILRRRKQREQHEKD